MLLSIVSSTLLLIIGMWMVHASLGPAWFGDGTVKIVEIRPGMSAGEVADTLHHVGAIRNPKLFLGVARLLQSDTKIQAGVYALGTENSVFGVLQRITEGHVVVHRITIPEGYTVRDIAFLLAERGLVDAERFMRLAYGDHAIELYGMSLSSLEGYLFPDTYEFRRGLSEERILTTLVNRFKEQVGPELVASHSTLSFHETVTLASIVEHEARRAEERPIIASVYLNRLRIGMPLQADPTVIYALPERPERVLYSHLEVDSAYNTYRHTGLPPGPIGNPGLASIRAVLQPAETPYLYFVAKADGSHHFSTTYNDHRAAIETYRP